MITSLNLIILLPNQIRIIFKFYNKCEGIYGIGLNTKLILQNIFWWIHLHFFSKYAVEWDDSVQSDF